MRRLLRHLAVLPLLLAAACAAPAAGPAPAGTSAEVTAVLQETAAAWNRADLNGHVAAYADTATFMVTAGLLRGKDRVRASLERSFWREGKPLQQLRYDSIQVRPLGRDHALSTGKFTLFGGGRPDRGGWFSLTWERTPAGWRIVHDHSS